MITASAPGKCILMGEHAVVHGYPAIAIALDIRSFCTLQPLSKGKIRFHVPDHNILLEFQDFSEMKKLIPPRFSQFSEVLGVLTQDCGIHIKNISIKLYSELWSGAGLGSSASTAVAFLIAINKFYNLELSDAKINEYAFFMEKIVHGNPSGIDNAICSSGGAVIFQNGVREKLILSSFPVLLIYSGIPHNTGAILRSLEEKREFLNESFVEIKRITEEGIIAIKEKKYLRLGELCDKNHEILSKIGLSTPDIEKIVAVSRDNGAYGSKITGAGSGGCVLTLGEESQLRKIQFLLKKQGYLSKITQLDYNGGRIDSK